MLWKVNAPSFLKSNAWVLCWGNFAEYRKVQFLTKFSDFSGNSLRATVVLSQLSSSGHRGLSCPGCLIPDKPFMLSCLSTHVPCSPVPPIPDIAAMFWPSCPICRVPDPFLDFDVTAVMYAWLSWVQFNKFNILTVNAFKSNDFKFSRSSRS